MNDALVKPVTPSLSVGKRIFTRWTHINEQLEEISGKESNKAFNVWFYAPTKDCIGNAEDFFQGCFNNAPQVTKRFVCHGKTYLPNNVKYITQLTPEVDHIHTTVGRDIHVFLGIRPHMWVYNHIVNNSHLLGDRIVIDLELPKVDLLGINERLEDCTIAG